MALRSLKKRIASLLGGAFFALALWTPTPGWAVSVPTSHPGSLPAQPTSSIVLGSSLATYRSWWASPVDARQTAWKNSIISRANQTLTAAVPADFNASMLQSSIAQARAFRYIMDPTAATAANDLSSVNDVLKNYAKCVGGTNITKPEVAMSYYLAFDYINAGINATDRASITTRLSGSNVQGTLGNFLMPSNNQQAKRAATRGFGALLFKNDTEIDSMLSSLNSSFASNTTDDGAYTDSQNHYFGYMSHQVPEFLVAYKNYTGIDLGPNITPFVTMGLGMMQPNGTIPSFHNGTNGPTPIGQYSRLISDPTLKANAVWTMTNMQSHDWTSWSNTLNNDWTYTTFFPMEDFSVTPAAPTMSPTFFSGGQATNAAFRNNWTTSSHYLGITGGVDGSGTAGFANYDTGAMVICANGTQVICEPGYNRNDLSNTPAGFDSSRATEHNIILAKDTGGATWGAGNANAQTPTGKTTTVTNRLDSKEFGGYAGVSDFQSMNINYGAGTAAGNDVSGRRDTAFANEQYFIVADNFTRTDTTNKDFGFNLIGKGPMTVLTNTSTLMEVKWDVSSYGTYNNGAVINGYPYNQPVNGQVILHLVSNKPMTLTTDTTWMHENYNIYQQTNRMRAVVTNVADVSYLSIMELGSAGGAMKYTVTNISGASFAGAKVDNPTDGWIDYVAAQRTSSQITAGKLGTNAVYGYLRETGGSVLDNLMIAGGTNLYYNGSLVIASNNAVTTSIDFLQASSTVNGTLSADGRVANTYLDIYGFGDIVSATFNGSAMTFDNTAADSARIFFPGTSGGSYSVVFGSGFMFGSPSVGSSFDITTAPTSTPEPTTFAMIGLAIGAIAAGTRRRRA